MKKPFLLIFLALFSYLNAVDEDRDPSKHFKGIFTTDSTLVSNCKIIKSYPISRIVWYENGGGKHVYNYIIKYKAEMENQAIRGNWDAIVNFKTTTITEGGMARYAGVNTSLGVHMSGVIILEGVQVAIECK